MDNEVPAGTPHNAPGPNDRAALTPEGAAIGMWWEMPDNAAERDFPDAVLHQEDVPKVWASVAMERGLRGMVAEIGTFGAERGDLQDNYATLDEGMAAAEGWALLEINREMRSYSSEVKLSEGFLRGIESLAAQRDAQTERGAEMDGGLEL